MAAMRELTKNRNPVGREVIADGQRSAQPREEAAHSSWMATGQSQDPQDAYPLGVHREEPTGQATAPSDVL